MDIKLELGTRYHERQKEKRPEASKSNSSHPQNSSTLSQKKKNFQKRDKPSSSLLNKDFKLMNSEKERRIKEGLCTYCGELQEKIPLIILDSSESPSLFVTHHSKYIVELPSFPRFEWDFLVFDTPKGEDLILGFDFLNHFNTSTDWRQGLITFNADQKDYSYPLNSFSNDLSSSKSCAALVGDSRTPSFPSSVHISSLNSHQ
ncbi:hypothetical protein O181_018799 [Austropuccinia psidii MF-1]|uniref:Uncharacterized protein n=1 Tax=Austropuccinia psidii MF-1 TaxID=1389203 RepID=A0A9Q3C5W4_9BASI|nr:hypothetical protein [Austropuccinia psidii MF-1]